MQITRTQPSPTTTKISVKASPAELDETKQAVLARLSADIKVPGFRPGKAPAGMVEKHLDPSALQTEFLEQAINQLYVDAVRRENLRPVAQPKIEVTKFVPFTTLEFTAEVEAVGDIKLPNYKLIKIEHKQPVVTAKDINDVIDRLRQRAATKKQVDRPAKAGDEVVIDFKGSDAKTKKPIEGADGKEYPLALGSKTFIPGFEEKLVGVKPGGKKKFNLAFPKDYGVKELQGREVVFEVTVLKVSEQVMPQMDDKFAATVGPFKTVADLKADIKKQLTTEKQQEAHRAFDNELLEKIAAKTTVSIPMSLVEEEIGRMEEEEKRNVVYRGQTWPEHLKAEGLTDEQHREKQRPGAELRVKAGLVLGAIADKEQINVTPEELEIRIQLLKGQYPDANMQAELDKPENRRDIHSRMMTEKTLDKLRGYSKKK
ncbi:MAG TPA: trigger factor [Candidatus Saccharimonadales bacterium]|nr:trigger factor [Candidatus Saccharimonadales bacterium]